MSDLLTDEQIRRFEDSPAVNKFPRLIFAHAYAANAEIACLTSLNADLSRNVETLLYANGDAKKEIARLQAKAATTDRELELTYQREKQLEAEVARLTSRLEEAREAGRKVVDIWLKTDDSYVNFGSLMLDLQEAVIADTKQSKDAAHHHRQRGRDSDMKCPSCGALAEVPGHYSWCEIQPPDSAPEERERRTPEWYASEQVKAHELEGACRIARDLGYATGHADTYDDLLQHVREQRNEDTKRRPRLC